MLHPRKDYQRIQDPEGKIPVNEPVFLLRGQDHCAADTVRFWSAINLLRGGDGELSTLAMEHADKMEDWHVDKIADLPPETEQPASAETEQPPESRAQIVLRHISRLHAPPANREQAIKSVRLFAHWIQVDLAKALGCKVSEAPEAVADYLGFAENQQAEPGGEEKNSEN